MTERVKYEVMRLRRKLGQGEGEPGARIEAVRGFGYRAYAAVAWTERFLSGCEEAPGVSRN